MSLDLTLLLVVLFFAVLGALSGAAKQVAHTVGVIAAYACARPLGALLGPRLAHALGSSAMVGVAVATLLAFVGTWMVVRALLTRILRRVLAGKEPTDRGVDRTLGFLLGGLKVALFCYVLLCLWTFIDGNVVIAGKALKLRPRDSLAFALARRYNVIELAQFKSVRDLVALANASQDPGRMERLQASPDFLALKRDPKFQKAMSQEGVRQALEKGDTQALMKSGAILQLLQDRTAMDQLERAMKGSE